ncbi:MAG: hypothetical protein KDC80_13215 [Saprospiraceae bacterium]|nr:hypothetical protein [Saprospiraceae bacterium]
MKLISQQNNQDLTWQETLLAPLDYATNKLAAESIYIQTSKDIYETQEDLWFNAFVLNAQSLQPSKLSRTLYVELIQEKTDSIVWQEKYEIQDGIAEGHIFLDDSLANGTYLVAAFTPHSFVLNAPEIHSVRRIEVIDFIRNYSRDFPLIDWDSVQLSFFPEGGHLIEGLKSQVAFRVTEKQGRPVTASGTLLENGQKLLSFKSVHAGMGSFSFIPREGYNYTVKLDDQKKIEFPLPEAQKSGMVLHLAERDEHALVFQIDRSPGPPPEKIYLRTQIRGEAHSIATGVIDSTLKFKVPLHKMPQGIAEVTLFDEHFIPVAERLVYVNQEKRLSIETNLAKEGHPRRGKTTFNIKVRDESGEPVSMTLGLSICESIFKDSENPNNILSHYYLSSQIKGKIYDPAYYFRSENKDRLVALDLLLLTQGWRRYIWNHELLQGLPIIDETPIIGGIKGTIQPRRKRRWEKGNYPTLIAYVPEQSGRTNFINVDSDGKFMVEPDHLKIGEGGFTYIKYFPSDDMKFNLNLHNNAFDTIDLFWRNSEIFHPWSQRKRQSFENENIALRSGSGIIQLDEIVVMARKNRQSHRDKYLGQLDSLAKLEFTTDYVCKHNNLNCPGCRNDPKNTRPKEGETYLLLQVWENNRFIDATLPPKPGQRFTKKWLPPYQYPKLTDAFLLENFNLIRTKGYYGHKEFYQPDYEELYDPAPDYRNTLLWAPNIKTDEYGEATITFFCSDLPGLFKGEIEGVSMEGLLGHHSFEFMVEN